MPPFVGDVFGDPRIARASRFSRARRRLRRPPAPMLVDWDSKRRVAAGMAWLDEVAPGWMSRIDLDDLDVASVRRCVCGQVFGPGAFRRMEEEYGRTWAWNHGFRDQSDTAVWVAVVLRSRSPVWIDHYPVVATRGGRAHGAIIPTGSGLCRRR